MDIDGRKPKNDRHIQFRSPEAVEREERKYQEQRAREKAEHEAQKQRARESSARYWANITPEEREARRLKTNATRKANEERRKARELAEIKEAERKAQARLKRKAKKELTFGPMVPDERHAVPGGSGLYNFEAIPQSYLYKRNQVFWLYVDMSAGPDACWPWHGDQFYDSLNRPTGYGSAYWRRGYTGAHRVAWMLNSGFYIPPGLVVDHMCEVKWCVNPDHLLVCTQGHNTRMRSNRPPEFTRTATSTEPPWDDRWYPFGRRKYDEAGNLKPEYREDATWRDEPEEQVKIPEFGFGEGAISPPYPQRPIGGYVIEEPLIPDNEEF